MITAKETKAERDIRIKYSENSRKLRTKTIKDKKKELARRMCRGNKNDRH